MKKGAGSLKKINLTMYPIAEPIELIEDPEMLLGRKLERAEESNQKLVASNHSLVLMLNDVLEKNKVLKKANVLLKKSVKEAINGIAQFKSETDALKASVVAGLKNESQIAEGVLIEGTSVLIKRISDLEDQMQTPHFLCPVCFTLAICPAVCSGTSGVPHRLCLPCFITWTNGHANCPVCRKNLRRDQLPCLFGECYQELPTGIKELWRESFHHATRQR